MNKAQKREVYLKDTKSKINYLPTFIRHFFISKYYIEGFFYVEKNFMKEKPTYISSTIKWLEKVIIETYSEKRAYKLAREFFNEKYSEYKEFVQLW